MTTMVANATRVAAVAEDATRLLGLRSPGARAADVIATKRRHGHLSPGGLAIPVRGQALSNAVDPGAGAGAGNPLIALLDQPGFVAPGLVGSPGASGVGGGPDVALPPPAFTPGGIVVIGGGGGATGSTGGTTTTGGTTSTGGDPTSSTSGGTTTTSTGGTTTTGGTTSSSTGGSSTTSTGGETTTSGGTTSTTSSTGGTASSSGGDPIGPDVPAVPEPSTWLMMIAGFAAIGTAMRRVVRHSPARGA